MLRHRTLRGSTHSHGGGGSSSSKHQQLGRPGSAPLRQPEKQRPGPGKHLTCLSNHPIYPAYLTGPFDHLNHSADVRGQSRASSHQLTSYNPPHHLTGLTTYYLILTCGAPAQMPEAAGSALPPPPPPALKRPSLPPPTTQRSHSRTKQVQQRAGLRLSNHRW